MSDADDVTIDCDVTEVVGLIEETEVRLSLSEIEPENHKDCFFNALSYDCHIEQIDKL